MTSKWIIEWEHGGSAHGVFFRAGWYVRLPGTGLSFGPFDNRAQAQADADRRNSEEEFEPETAA